MMTTFSRLDTLLSFLEADPEDSFTRFALAQEYRKLGDTAQAALYFEDLTRRDPNYVGTYYHLGKLYEHLGRTEEAIRTYHAGVSVARRKRDAHAEAELRDALLNASGIGED